MSESHTGKSRYTRTLKHLVTATDFLSHVKTGTVYYCLQVFKRDDTIFHEQELEVVNPDQDTLEKLERSQAVTDPAEIAECQRLYRQKLREWRSFWSNCRK